MSSPTTHSLLDADEPPAFRVSGEAGRSPFLLTCDHASAAVPRRLGSLGLSDADLERHIAWDIGAAAVAVKLAGLLDAFLIRQSYSRLVIDCNRPVGSDESIVQLSESTCIPGNEAVTAADRTAREQEVFWPYHRRIGDELDRRAALALPTILIAVHSFTPVYHDYRRPWYAGLLYNRDSRLAQALLPHLQSDSDLLIGVNEPYSVDDETDYTIPQHGERRGLLHVGIELRQDLVGDEAGQAEWALRLARVLTQAQAELTSDPGTLTVADSGGGQLSGRSVI